MVSDEVLSTTAIGEWVNALFSLAVNMNSGLTRARLAAPQLAPLRLDVAVERGVDLEHVDVLRQVLDRMLRLLDLRRIDDAFPVFVRPAGSSNVNVRVQKAINFAG